MPEPTLLNKIKMRLYENDIVDTLINRNLIQKLKLIKLSVDTNYACLFVNDGAIYNVEIINEGSEYWEYYKEIGEGEIYRTDYEIILFTPTLNKNFKLIISKFDV